MKTTKEDREDIKKLLQEAGCYGQIASLVDDFEELEAKLKLIGNALKMYNEMFTEEEDVRRSWEKNYLQPTLEKIDE